MLSTNDVSFIIQEREREIEGGDEAVLSVVIALFIVMFVALWNGVSLGGGLGWWNR